jgi:succinylarginine dihydrolase
MPVAYEVNFDSIVGPTHNYAGLAYGNLASQKHGQSASNPKAAALEGLGKMKLLMDLGVKQAVLPPHERPDFAALRRLGFNGSENEILDAAYRADPALLASCYSASAMWAANAATVSPSADSGDGRVHFTPANLISQFHRSLETATTGAILWRIFGDSRHFVHHPALPATLPLADEGAANHSRLAGNYGEAGVELFVYGRRALDASAAQPRRFPARQAREASAAIARLHPLAPGSVILAQQDPEAIDAGVFHNDVIAVGNLNVLLCHERAFLDRQAMLGALRKAFAKQCGGELVVIEAAEGELSVQEAVSSYLFNSQLVTLPEGGMALIAPRECAESEAVQRFMERIVGGSGPLEAVHYVEIRQSMRNGGGPACLRLRVVLTEAELAAMHQGVLLTAELYEQLLRWVERHYRDRLVPEDLRDPGLAEESLGALDELTKLLSLGPLYPFQKA